MDSTTKCAEPPIPGAPGTQVPDWELPPIEDRKQRRSLILVVPSLPSGKSPFSGLSEKAKRKMRAGCVCSPYPWAGIDRKWFVIIIAGVILVLAAIGIGLGVGLSKGKKLSSGSQSLPLPNNAEKHTGDLTYYGVGLGACGITSTENQDVVAVSHSLFDASQTGSDPNANPLCGQKIRATRYYAEVGSERSVDLTVVDRCVGCQPTDLDVSTGAFDQLAPEPSGRVDVTWAWLSPQATGK
ncbi:hypothetical protein NA57DRAFT_56225 [Rhizodiscina lignyota]|uniref:RlpA-like protein double-psi beta-barrel domain-containing protein n=1 Tax=Rhizodiscina lignyota TaxID=1504668 RepID=A0A9P4IEK1_9PEZI|nr:hypothetical protein NA57DRAFT_56225 [Rhizodiscina lignyota]